MSKTRKPGNRHSESPSTRDKLSNAFVEALAHPGLVAVATQLLDDADAACGEGDVRGAREKLETVNETVAKAK